MRIRGLLHAGCFIHHLVVERGAARGIEHHHIEAAEAPGFERAARDLRRRLALDDGECVDAHLPAERRELFHRGRTARIERGHQHLALALLGEAPRDLGGGGGFTRALQSDHHHGDRRRRVEVDRIGVRAERLDQLVVHQLHDHLARRDRLDHRDADGVLLHLIDERAHHVERDVRLKQRAAHLAHRGIDVGLRQRAAPRQAIENSTKPFRQTVEHAVSAASSAIHKTLSRPRAHRAVGRWPPASGAGRRTGITVSCESGRRVRRRPRIVNATGALAETGARTYLLTS